MLRYQDLTTKNSRFLALTGLKVEEFAVLLAVFQEAFDWYMCNHTMTGQKREYRRYTTYANSPLPTIEDKLLFILVFLKHNLHQEIQGSLFGMSQTNVSKWVYLLHTSLNWALARQSYLPIRTAEEFTIYVQKKANMEISSITCDDTADSGKDKPESAYDPLISPEDATNIHDRTSKASSSLGSADDTEMPAASARETGIGQATLPDTEMIQESGPIDQSGGTFFHDGVERPINRPCDPYDQEDYYSGKKKQHMLKNIVITDIKGKVPFLSATRAGRLHDKRVADESGYTFPEGSTAYQDSGFQGFAPMRVTIIQPKKKPRGGELTPAEKEENRRISSIRVFIEHVICSIKRYRVVKEKIRLWKGNIRDKVMETCCGLHNFRITFRPLQYAENKA